MLIPPDGRLSTRCSLSRASEADIQGVHRNDRSREKTTFPPANHLAPAPNIPRSITIPMA